MRTPNDLIYRFFEILSEHGPSYALGKVVRYPRRAIALWRGRREFERDVLSVENPEHKFTWIFERNAWGSNESRSGPGSTLKNTETLRAELPSIVREFGVSTLLDAPCGDFNWMRHVLDDLKCDYVGMDIVPALIESNQASYDRRGVRFVCGDLTNGDLPDADMMLCRDCLFHFSYADILKTLENFLRSGVPYLLTTTHRTEAGFENKNIVTGDWRRINLFLAPFHFPLAVKLRVDDTGSGTYSREMCIWDRTQVETAVGVLGRVVR